MKKCFLYLAGLLVLLAYSCTDEQLVEQTGNKLRITGSVASDSRTTFVEGDGVIETHWNIDDEIGLTLDCDWHVYNSKYASTNNGKSTEFIERHPYDIVDLGFSDGQVVHAYYPYCEWGDNESAGILCDYHKHKGDVLPFLYGKAQVNNSELNFQFKHLFAYLKIVISAEYIQNKFSEFSKRYESYGYSPIFEGSYIKISNSEESGIVPYHRINLKTHEPSYVYNDVKLVFGDNIDLSSNKTYSFMVPILPQSEGIEIKSVINFMYDNGGYSYRSAPTYEYTKTVPLGGLQAGHVYVWNFIDDIQHEKNMQLLKSFYEKTGGPQWMYNENWLSTEPLTQWYGVNNNVSSEYIKTLDLRNNLLSGQIPEELAEMMDHLVYLDLGHNKLYGPIPDVVKNHKKWNELGWLSVEQDHWDEKELDLTNSNLYIDNATVEDLFSDEGTVKELYEIFKQNKLTQVTGCDFYNNGKPHTIDDVHKTFIKERVNLHLDYQGKGLHTIFFLGDTGTDDEENELRNSLHGIYGEVDGITWMKGDNTNTSQYRSASYFYDSNGQLVYVALNNPTCPNYPEELLIEKTGRFLRSTLGEPVEHPEFTPEIYTSTDYSRDGEVVTLQEATVGQGINLTFLGEAFVDKDMEPGGLYEQTMREAMEQFFSYEPYKSFRNRFNVYAVKVVSPNGVDVEGAKYAINGSITVCLDYAQKIPNADKNPPMVTVICRDFNWDPSDAGRSYTYMLDDGSFVAYLLRGIDDASVLMHEAGGHGFGGLLDEYVESGNEELTLSEEARMTLDYVWSQYGRGANVDWRNNASTVKWAHFLNDNRYANEGLGIYEGAYLYGYGAYRPNENSIMRNNYADGVQFNAPSREQIYKRIMQRSEGKSWTYDYEKFVEYDAINRKSATRAAVRPLSEAEKKEYAKKHCPPIFIKGTWRDAMKNGKSNTVVPLR